MLSEANSDHRSEETLQIAMLLSVCVYVYVCVCARARARAHQIQDHFEKFDNGFCRGEDEGSRVPGWTKYEGYEE